MVLALSLASLDRKPTKDSSMTPRPSTTPRPTHRRSASTPAQEISSTRNPPTSTRTPVLEPAEFEESAFPPQAFKHLRRLSAPPSFGSRESLEQLNRPTGALDDLASASPLKILDNLFKQRRSSNSKVKAGKTAPVAVPAFLDDSFENASDTDSFCEPYPVLVS